MDATREGHRSSGGVVVGFDGSTNAENAVVWAADEARRRGVRLRIVTAAHFPGMPSAPGTEAPIVPRSLESISAERAARGRRLAAGTLAEADIETSVVGAAATTALVEASAGASLVVVGHRGHGSFASAVLGSVSMALAQHAHCPVVVVRGASQGEGGPPRPVTVGVDGTPESEEVLVFAAAAAADRGAPLHVVCAWSTPPQAGWEFSAWPMEAVAEWEGALTAAARAAVDEAASQARRQWPGLHVETRTPAATPTLALEEASRGSSLVVVGTHSRGVLGRMAIGSVSRSVLHHAACPVAVVRSRRE